jgi:ABC-type uncharacterized transport system permease subunit
MTEQVIISIVSGAGFSLAAIASYLHLRHHVPRMLPLMRVAAAAAIAASIVHLGTAFAQMGVVAALQSYFSSAVLLSTLIGLVGLGVHLSASLKGLEGVLFLAAGAIGFLEIGLLNQTPAAELTGRPWFISHGLAFALSAAFFIVGGAASVAYLLVLRMLRRKRAVSMMGNVAPLESLERFGRWMPIIGFPLFTFGILSGLCGVAHRPDLSRISWYWDPTFVLSLGAWVIYAYLCLALLYRPQIRGRRAAVLSTYGLGLFVVAFFARELTRLHQ